MTDKNKIMLVASPGGHFVELSLVAECLQDMHVMIVSTYDEKPSFMHGDEYFQVSDFSRDNAQVMFKVLRECYRILKKNKPKLIVTTGAAPGLIMAIVGRFFGIKSIWIDSIANSQYISLSGKIAKAFGIKVFSQWESVAKSSNSEYHGKLL